MELSPPILKKQETNWGELNNYILCHLYTFLLNSNNQPNCAFFREILCEHEFLFSLFHFQLLVIYEYHSIKHSHNMLDQCANLFSLIFLQLAALHLILVHMRQHLQYKRMELIHNEYLQIIYIYLLCSSQIPKDFLIFTNWLS